MRISIVGLPRSGQGSHGDIVVTLRGTSKSNTFTLSEWRGDFKIQNPVSEGAGTVDTLFTEATVSAHIRFVFDPATVGKTSALKGPFTAAFDTKVVVKTGGQHTDATKDETWALNGAADVTYASIVASPDRYAFMTGNVDPTVWPLKMDMAHEDGHCKRQDADDQRLPQREDGPPERSADVRRELLHPTRKLQGCIVALHRVVGRDPRCEPAEAHALNRRRIGLRVDRSRRHARRTRAVTDA